MTITNNQQITHSLISDGSESSELIDSLLSWDTEITSSENLTWDEIFNLDDLESVSEELIEKIQLTEDEVDFDEEHSDIRSLPETAQKFKISLNQNQNQLLRMVSKDLTQLSYQAQYEVLQKIEEYDKFKKLKAPENFDIFRGSEYKSFSPEIKCIRKNKNFYNFFRFKVLELVNKL